MKLLIPIEKLEELTYKDLVPLECVGCNSVFYRTPGEVKRGLKGTRNVSYCNQRCAWDNYPYKRSRTEYSYICKQCNKNFKRTEVPADHERNKNKEKFCSKKCTCLFIRTNCAGQGRSKIERWLEEKLKIQYPFLEILYNDRKTIKSELDIYIPSLKLAFELNGIFHYEEIFNKDQLSKIQTNDKRKFQACLENNIELCMIDTTSMRNFVQRKADIFLGIIVKIIEEKMERIPRYCTWSLRRSAHALTTSDSQKIGNG